MEYIDTEYGTITKHGPWYLCPYCDKGVYETKGHMLRHLKQRHPDKKLVTQAPKQIYYTYTP